MNHAGCWLVFKAISNYSTPFKQKIVNGINPSQLDIRDGSMMLTDSKTNLDQKVRGKNNLYWQAHKMAEMMAVCEITRILT